MPDSNSSTIVAVPVSSIWSSKTFWTQLIGITASVGAVFGLDLTPEDQLAIVTAIQGVAAVITIVLKQFARPTITPGQATKLPSGSISNP